MVYKPTFTSLGGTTQRSFPYGLQSSPTPLVSPVPVDRWARVRAVRVTSTCSAPPQTIFSNCTSVIHMGREMGRFSLWKAQQAQWEHPSGTGISPVLLGGCLPRLAEIPLSQISHHFVGNIIYICIYIYMYIYIYV